MTKKPDDVCGNEKILLFLASPKLLPFGNEIKNLGFCFAFRSLIRNFASTNTNALWQKYF
jgi:hypothetical protein